MIYLKFREEIWKGSVETVNQVMQMLKRQNAERRIPALRLEIDYELVTLHDAMVVEDEETIKQSKDRLQELRQEMLRLEA